MASRPGPLPFRPRTTLAAMGADELIGCIRRWHPAHGWGFVWSHKHAADIYLESFEDFSEGDYVIFDMVTDQDGLPTAMNPRMVPTEAVTRERLTRWTPRIDDEESRAASAFESPPKRICFRDRD